jgi:hypothetical protein
MAAGFSPPPGACPNCNNCQKTIAVPLSKLKAAEGEVVRIWMMRTSLEAEPEFDESELAPDEPPPTS